MEVFREEITAKVVFETYDDATDVCGSMGESFIVAGVGYDDVVSLISGMLAMV